MAEQSLREFVTTHTLPARVKVTEGLCNEEQTDWEFSNGDVLDLHRIVCPTVELSFVDPTTGSDRSVTASTSSPCVFRILPHVVDRAAVRSRSLLVRGVLELIRVWPTLVCAQSSYRVPGSDVVVGQGDRLRLKRLVRRDGVRTLECSTQRSQLVRLPLSCDVGFFAIEDNAGYTLAEIADIPGRVDRRLRLGDDAVNQAHRIRGLPADPDVDLIMRPPQRFVEIHPAESPGEQLIVPIDVDITVSDRDDDYVGLSFKWYPLDRFVHANHSRFPMVVSIADWDEEPVSLQAIRASAGDRIVLYRRQHAFKVACQTRDRYFAAPTKYDAKFTVQPRRFTCLRDVCLTSTRRVRALSNSVSDEPGVVGLRRNDTVEIVRVLPTGFVEAKVNGSRIERLTQTMRGQFEEVSERAHGEMTLGQIEPGDLPLTVAFRRPSPGVPRTKDPMPRDEAVRLQCIFRDECVLASKDSDRGYSSLVPMRAAIFVRYISQFKKQAQAPRLSVMASCPEELSEELFRQLASRGTYENFETATAADEPPPILPRQRSLPARDDDSRRQVLQDNALQRSKTLHTEATDNTCPPVPPRPKFADKQDDSSSSPTRGRPVPVDSAPTKELLEECFVEDEKDYEAIADILDYNEVMSAIFGSREPPNITVPPNADLSRLGWQEMIVFLQLTAMPPESLRLFARDRITGNDFAMLDNQQLADYKVNFPIIRHFRNKSRCKGPLADIL